MKYKKTIFIVFILVFSAFIVSITNNIQATRYSNNNYNAFTNRVSIPANIDFNNSKNTDPLNINSVNIIQNDVQNLVDPNRIYKAEPAPMGLADFGINPSTNKPYSYNTTSFLGIAKIFSLTTTGGSLSGFASLQLNAMLKFSAGSETYVYLLQNVAIIDTITKQLIFADNIWNTSKINANIISPSNISGSGKFETYNSTTFYYCTDRFSYVQTYPNTIQMKITSSLVNNSIPTITFAYDNGNGSWIPYDNVTFLPASNSVIDMNLVVNGSEYTPYNNYYNAEFILGSMGGGTPATVQSNTKMNLQLEYYTGNDYQFIPNAYNFGSNVLEKVSNVVTNFYNNTNSSIPYIELTAGSGGNLGPVNYVPNQTNLWLILGVIGIVVIGVVISLVVYFSLNHRKKLEKLKKTK